MREPQQHSPQRTAIRVSVQVPGYGGEKVFMVRVLDEVEEAPPGAQEALLVALRPGVEFTKR